MRNYLFIGGPWDGLWEEVSGEHHVNLSRPSEFDVASKDDVYEPMEIYTYTLRYIYVGRASIEVYVMDNISDNHLLTKLLSVYTRT